MPEVTIKDLVLQRESETRYEIQAEIGFSNNEPYIMILKDGSYEHELSVEIDSEGRVVLLSRPYRRIPFEDSRTILFSSSSE